MRYHSMTCGNCWKTSYRGWVWLGLLVFLAPVPAKADPTCGSTVTSNVTLTTDITCMNMTWITIGADNITIDVNGQQIDGSVENVMPYGDLRPKYESFGWKVLEMDGSNMEEIISTLMIP